MPLYEYRCPSGHVTTELRRMSEKEAPLVCACGERAAPILSVTAPGKVVGSTTPVKAATAERPTIRETGHSLLLIDWTCTCGASTYDVYDARPDTKPTCACGLTMYEKIGVPDVDWFTKAASGNPLGVWDAAAQRYWTSKGERAAWMEANGFIDGNDVDSDQIKRIGSERRRQNDEYCEQMCDEYDRDPAIRRLRDEGRVKDWSHLRPSADVR